MRRFLLLAGLMLSALTVHADVWMEKKKTTAGFEDTRETVVTAIESRGLVINYTAHIGSMLERTGVDLGASRRIFDQAQIIEFCSARLSRQMVELDPHNIVLCPFAISIYTLPGETGTWVAYRRPAGAAAELVEPLLKSIAAEAMQ